MQTKSPQELTQARLRELLDYNPETGVFTRRTGPYVGKKAGGLNGIGYLIIAVDGRQYSSHRLAFLWMTGAWPEHEIDHIDGDRGNNRWINLREATPTENQHNRGRANKNNKSGLLGVFWYKKKGAWMAQMTVDWKPVRLGYFPTPELAHAAYLKAKDDLHPTHMRLRNHGR